MYYSSDSISPSFIDRALESEAVQKRHRPRHPWRWVAALLVGIGAGWLGLQAHPSVVLPQNRHVSAPQVHENKPEVAGVSFGDLLKKKITYPGWLIGTQAGSIHIFQPQSGQKNNVTTVESMWRGPISSLVWSPDRTQISYLTMPLEDAQALEKNPADFMASMHLSALPTAESFPFGRLTIVDVATKQVTQTSIEVRNTPKALVWLSDDQIAMVGRALMVYHVRAGTTTEVSGAGNTTNTEQLQSPLFWQPDAEKIWFSRIKRHTDKSIRTLESIALNTSSVTKVATLRVGTFEEAARSQGIDYTLSGDGERLAVTVDGDLSYLTLSDGGSHILPDKPDWLWLKSSTISQLQWLSSSRLSFSSLSSQGERIWGVWDIPNSAVVTFGKGRQAA